jgi:hypothetical protein
MKFGFVWLGLVRAWDLWRCAAAQAPLITPPLLPRRSATNPAGRNALKGGIGIAETFDIANGQSTCAFASLQLFDCASQGLPITEHFCH